METIQELEARRDAILEEMRSIRSMRRVVVCPAFMSQARKFSGNTTERGEIVAGAETWRKGLSGTVWGTGIDGFSLNVLSLLFTWYRNGEVPLLLGIQYPTLLVFHWRFDIRSGTMK